MHGERFHISGNIVDVVRERVYPGTLLIDGGKITRIREDSGPYSSYLIPGLVDAHVHIESSMLTPVEFARVASTHGTVACVSDPHEIANVLGMEGVDYMIRDSTLTPLKFFFGAPSCVPATPFETSGAVIGADEIAALLARKEIRFLSEVMNYPGVVAREPSLMKKIEAARALSKRVDGHAPGLRGETLARYVSAGIETDHETPDMDEALEKIGLGMKILIREGSAAKDFERLEGLIAKHSGMCMLCTDDMHPDDLIRSHIDGLVRRAIRKGHDPMNVLRCASLNPVRHYGLPVGLLQEGDPADFAVVDDLGNFHVLKTFVDGELAAEEGRPLLGPRTPEIVNVFRALPKGIEDFRIRDRGEKANVIEAGDGLLITGWTRETPRVINGFAVADADRDILKIAVVNRYRDAPPSVGFVKGFGLRHGAIASSVAHDSHNIVAVGASDEALCSVVNTLVANRGGLAATNRDGRDFLALPIAGLMSDKDGWETASRYSRLQRLAGELGSPLSAPFITLSFMALIVIPKLKMSDQGLFDAESFSPIDVFEKPRR
jgi:adenine deaminase